MLQNVNEVNREPAHIQWHLVHVTLTRQNCFVTAVLLVSRNFDLSFDNRSWVCKVLYFLLRLLGTML